MSDLSDRDLLIETNTTVKAMRAELFGGPGREGRIPKLENLHIEHGQMDERRFQEITNQLSYWKGALALFGFVVIVFGGVLLTHILLEKR